MGGLFVAAAAVVGLYELLRVPVTVAATAAAAALFSRSSCNLLLADEAVVTVPMLLLRREGCGGAMLNLAVPSRKTRTYEDEKKET